MSDDSVVGLVITESGIRGVQLSRLKSKTPVVTAHGEVAIPPGIAKDSEIVDRDAAVLALRKLWTQAGFTTKKVALGVGNRRVIVREVSAPDLPLAQIKRALPYQIGDLLPVPPEQAIIDFYPLRETVLANAEVAVEGLLVAVIAEMVEGIVATVKGAHLKVDSVDLLPFALTRVVTRTVSQDAPYLAVNVGANSTNVVVILNKIPQFVRMIPIGGDTIVAALAETFGIDLQSARGIHVRGSIADLAPQELARLESIRQPITELAARIKGTGDYYNAKEGTSPWHGVVLSGSAARLPMLAEGIETVTGQRVELLRPTAGLVVSRRLKEPFLDAQAIRFAMPIGLAMGESR